MKVPAKLKGLIVGQKIEAIIAIDLGDGDEAACLVLENDVELACLRDPEGNGPGHLEVRNVDGNYVGGLGGH